MLVGLEYQYQQGKIALEQDIACYLWMPAVLALCLGPLIHLTLVIVRLFTFWSHVAFRLFL